jgi:hypothetical protein
LRISIQLPDPLLLELPLWKKLGTDRMFTNLHSSKNWGTSRLSPVFVGLPVQQDQERRRSQL